MFRLKDEDVDMKDLELKTFPRVAFSSETIKTRSNKLDQASTKYDLWEEGKLCNLLFIYMF